MLTTSLGHRFEMLAFEFLHTQLPSFSPEVEMPVVVLDISQIEGGKGDRVTSRKALRSILEELVNQQARAIAVDLDFSPSENGWMDGKDPEFFEFCLNQQNRGVPIRLGIYRTALKKPCQRAV